MNTRPFQELVDKMRPEARAAAHEKAQEFLKEIRLSELRQERMLKQLGLKIAKLRKKRGLTLADFARFAEISQETVTRIESGNFNGCRFKTLAKIARVFDKQLVNVNK
jgi:DNA-binding XRE family transcriptional regulator